MFLCGEYLFPLKQVRVALRRFVGVGEFKAEELCHKALIHQFCRVCDLKPHQIEKLRVLIESVQEQTKQARILQMKRRAFLQSLKPKLIDK